MSNKTFATASNARRAARSAGLTLDQIEIVQNGAQFFYVVKNENEGDSAVTDTTIDESQIEAQTDAEINTNGTPSDRELVLMDSDGGEYGRVTEADAERMATMLAESEHRMIQVIDKDTLEPVLMVEYHAEAPDLAGPDATIEAEGSEVTVEPVAPVADVVALSLHAPYVTVPADKADAIAAAVVKILGSAIDVYDANAETLLRTIYRKPARMVVSNPEGAKVAKKDLPTGKMGILVALCMREEGASKAEMLQATGWKMIAGDTVQKVAAKYGLTFAKSADGKNKRYFLYREESEQIAA